MTATVSELHPRDRVLEVLTDMVGDEGAAVALREGLTARGFAIVPAPPGTAGYGWEWRDGARVPVESEQKMIRLILGWREMDPKVPTRTIAFWLNRDGHRRRDGGLWHHEQVRRVLQRVEADKGDQQ